MGWRWLRASVLGLLLLPAVAIGDAPPRVSNAVVGEDGGGAVSRFTLRFSEPMVPLGDPRAPAAATTTCPVASTGRWADPQTFVIEFARGLPGGLLCGVRLRDGLASARGSAVTGTRSWPVDTGGPTARAVLAGGGYGNDIEEGQVFLVAANVVPDRRSVAASGYCAVDGIGERIALDVLGSDVPERIVTGLGPDDWSLREFLESAGVPKILPRDAAKRRDALSTLVAVKCRRPLPPGRDMALVWGAGIADGRGRTAGRDQRYDFTVRKAFTARFECSRVNPQAGCNPITDAHVRFTAPIAMAAAKAVRLTFADGSVRVPAIDKSDTGRTEIADLRFKGPFPAAMTARLSLPAVEDPSGRTLENAERFPIEVRFDRAPPLIKFAATFGILEANEGGVLPVTVRAVEPRLERRVAEVGGARLRVDGSDGEIAAWLRRLDKADDSDFREVGPRGRTTSVNYTGATSVLRGGGAPMGIALPGRGKAFEVVGIPLRRPGFYVVELASPALGRALLGRAATRYVSAGALVTNMAVHFKWGREGSLAWVTTLDSGAPVAGADVRITNSCTGKLLARGVSDRGGRIGVRGLPPPETYVGCDGGPYPLMVSARKSGDFSFTLTDWAEGLRPSDFELPQGYSAPEDKLHTIFDRTLIRAGETVNMKHVIRRPVGAGFALAEPVSGTLQLVHRGSETQFEQPVAIGRDGIGLSTWTAPPGAPMGDYDLQVRVANRTISTGQSVRVDEFRLPTMRASVEGPKRAVVRPKSVPVALTVAYLSGGGASNMPVAIRTAFEPDGGAPEEYESFSFGGDAVVEGTTPLDGEGEAPETPKPMSQTMPVTLDASGTARASVDVGRPVDATTAMTVEMDYADANGETLTASRRILLHPSAVRLGVRTDGWLMRDSDLRLQFAAIGVDGDVARGQRIRAQLYSRETISARRRLIGGFYAYDNQARVSRIRAGCSAMTDGKGLATCAIDPGVSGEVIVVATTSDDDGNVARAVTTVWLAGEDEWWFGGDNGDRMDLVPEAKAYKAGETARLQVRMPFRTATALVTVEREGVLSSFVTTLSGKDPVIAVPMPASYAPDVYVSVLAVRGRVGGFRLWLATLARDWGLPFFSREGAGPTALVDLAKPSYRLGIARLKVGWEGHKLGVAVRADKAKYATRDTAAVEVAVTDPAGQPARSAELAFAAVDEALLQLSPNESWNLLDAMMGERTLDVLTSTAQMQVVGKRHYGRKAVEAGGDGGGDLSGMTREDFRPVLLWRGRVPLDANGRARIPVKLSDSLSAFRMVAVASSGAQLFGTGETTVRTAQDLSIFSGLPPLVRTGDVFGASFTIRNGSDRTMRVTANVRVSPRVANGGALTVTIPAGGSVPVTWNLLAPGGVEKLAWTVDARSADGRASDRLAVAQDVVPAVPTEVWAATLTRVGAGGTTIPVAAPAGARPGAFVDVRLSDTLAPPLAGVRAYMAGYPYACFEQLFSRAIVLGDAGAWGRLAGAMPTYLDRDGLLRYFPDERMEGSEALTAYVLTMAAEAGWSVPETSRGRMIAALQAVVEGRLRRDGMGPSDARLLRVAAVGALARQGASSPAMLRTVDIAPADMTTATLADWMVAIDRTPGVGNAPALRAQAEAILRGRIVYEGSRLDLTDGGSAPWWMMVSGDEMALRALGAVLGRPDWADETPRMMVGAALRQRRGHWDTTPANVWGAVVARRFAQLYPATAIAGTTTATLGPVSRLQSWPMASGAPPLRLPARNGPLMLRQSGGAGPWANVSLSAAVPLVRPLFAGYKMRKAVSIVSAKNSGRLTRGDVLRVKITVDASADRNWVVINDPVPPGATIIGGLGGQSAILGAGGSGGDGVYPSYVERGRDAWRGYYAWVPRGRFSVEYTMRLNGSGRFNLPPTRVEAMYSPEIRAQMPNRGLTVALR